MQSWPPPTRPGPGRRRENAAIMPPGRDRRFVLRWLLPIVLAYSSLHLEGSYIQSIHHLSILVQHFDPHGVSPNSKLRRQPEADLIAPDFILRQNRNWRLDHLHTAARPID